MRASCDAGMKYGAQAGEPAHHSNKKLRFSAGYLHARQALTGQGMAFACACRPGASDETTESCCSSHGGTERHDRMGGDRSDAHPESRAAAGPSVGSSITPAVTTEGGTPVTAAAGAGIPGPAQALRSPILRSPAIDTSSALYRARAHHRAGFRSAGGVLLAGTVFRAAARVLRAGAICRAADGVCRAQRRLLVLLRRAGRVLPGRRAMPGSLAAGTGKVTDKTWRLS